jgi:hypothetical protein
MNVKKLSLSLLMFLLVINFSNAKRFPNLIEGDYLVKNFTFKSGENLRNLNYIIQP